MRRRGANGDLKSIVSTMCEIGVQNRGRITILQNRGQTTIFVSATFRARNIQRGPAGTLFCFGDCEDFDKNLVRQIAGAAIYRAVPLAYVAKRNWPFSNTKGPYCSDPNNQSSP